MSIAAILAGAKTVGVVGGLAQTLGFGGDGPNIAKSLSKQVGCQILQENASQARALLLKGVNPCTGQATTGSQTVEEALAKVDAALGRTEAVIKANPKLIEAVGIGGIGGPMSALTKIGTFGGTVARGVGVGGIVLPTGRRISKRDAIAFLRRIGDVVTGAALLGITQQQAADLVIQGTKRRARGITAAQVRNARRTTGMVARLARDLGCCKPAPVRRRKPACR